MATYYGFDGVISAKSAPQTIDTNTPTTISFDINELDTGELAEGGGYHSTTVDNKRFYARRSGFYIIGGAFRVTSTAPSLGLFGGYRINGVTPNLWFGSTMALVIAYSSGISIRKLNKGDYIEFVVTQEGGSAVTITPDNTKVFFKTL